MDILVLTQILDDSNSQTLDGNNLFFLLPLGRAGSVFSLNPCEIRFNYSAHDCYGKSTKMLFFVHQLSQTFNGSVIFIYMYHRFKPIHVGKYTIHYIERLGLLTIFQGVTWKHPLELPPSEVFFCWRLET